MHKFGLLHVRPSEPIPSESVQVSIQFNNICITSIEQNIGKYMK